METTTLNVEGMSCEHCVRAVTNAVSALPGVENVAVNLTGKTVTVGYDTGKTALDAIKSAITEEGYDIVE